MENILIGTIVLLGTLFLLSVITFFLSAILDCSHPWTMSLGIIAFFIVAYSIGYLIRIGG